MRWTNVFCAVPATMDGLSGDGQTGDGRAVAGAGGDKSHKDFNQKDLTQREREKPRSLSQTESGICYQAGNARDEQALAAISKYPADLISAAAEEAAKADPRGTAWPGATLAAARKLASERKARDEVAALISAPKIPSHQARERAAEALAKLNRLRMRQSS